MFIFHVFTRLIASASNNICSRRVILSASSRCESFYADGKVFSIKVFCSTLAFLLSTSRKDSKHVLISFESKWIFSKHSWSAFELNSSHSKAPERCVACRQAGRHQSRKGRETAEVLVSLRAQQIAARGVEMSNSTWSSGCSFPSKLLVHVNCIYLSLWWRAGRQLGRCMPNWTCKLRLSGSCLQGNAVPKHRFDALRCLSQIYVRN